MLKHYSGNYSLLLLEKSIELLQEYQLEAEKAEQADPWVELAGIFSDDPLSQEFFDDMSAYRRELEAHRVGLEENQPV